jgi:hypothetical protein
MRSAVWSRVRFLLEEEPPTFAPALRIVLCAVVAWDRLPSEARIVARMSPRAHELVHAPVIDAIGLPMPPPAAVLEALPATLMVLALLAAMGLCTRPALLVLGLCWLYVGAIRSGLGFFNHTPALACQLVLVLAFAPGATGYSLDRVLLWWWRGRHGDAIPFTAAVNPPAARFGDRLLLLLIGLLYFSAGVSKLRYGAVGWLSGETLAFYLGGLAREPQWYGPVVPDPALAWKDGFQIDGYLYQGRLTPLGAWIARHRALTAVSSWFSLTVELAAPLCLLSGPRVRTAWILAAQLFHVGIIMLMGPAFRLWQVIIAVALPWREAWSVVSSRWRGHPATHLLDRTVS